jgi:hypothetical protein
VQLLPFDRCETVRLSADVDRRGDLLEFVYRLEHGAEDIVIPPAAPPERTDGLWTKTCFEAFIATGKTGYLELNFAPSGQWAAYSFSTYRQGMRELDVGALEIAFSNDRLVARVQLDAPRGAAFNLTAVVEHRSGTRSYWALAHPSSNRPDFHARDCFVAKLP